MTRAFESLSPVDSCGCCFFFFNDTATTEIYTLSLHDALPISGSGPGRRGPAWRWRWRRRSEEHTSELQSPCNLVCRLLLEKKKEATSSTPSQASIGPTRPPRSHMLRA